MATQQVQIGKRVLVVAGIGNGSGTGGASARLFAKNGYSIALIARGEDHAKKLADEINASGGEAASFSIASYATEDISAAWKSIHERYPKPTYSIRAAIFNAAHGVWKPFLEVTPQDIQDSVQINIAAAFAFSREAILTFKENEVDQGNGKRGALIFTGATASLRGNVATSAFAAGKFGTRALSQSLAKEFGKQNIHVSHAIIDGKIATDRNKASVGDAKWDTNEDIRLSPNSIASDRSSWTWELDLRPAHEKW